ncbi:hypothetical protein BDV96DRAFT_590463 [Lophiotrema nucula]|uniref:Uncharacterized protein n=1 Tax=Lophiotrema nucula TaxID=690887 RepID=A0A6A5YJ91_9PLEO|nr:hypothetical protein BDV96DRAFT_590463 [Lophiotrema nucula]
MATLEVSRDSVAVTRMACILPRRVDSARLQERIVPAIRRSSNLRALLKRFDAASAIYLPHAAAFGDDEHVKATLRAGKTFGAAGTVTFRRERPASRRSAFLFVWQHESPLDYSGRASTEDGVKPGRILSIPLPDLKSSRAQPQSEIETLPSSASMTA